MKKFLLSLILFFVAAGAHAQAGKVICPGMPALTGDVTSSAGSCGTTLANSGVTAGTYENSATQISPLILDAKGRVTGIGSAVTITPAWGSVTGKPTTLSGYGITDGLNVSQLGAISGVAQLDGTGKLPLAQLPSGIPNANLANSSVTVSGVGCTLGASCTLSGLPNSALTNSSITVNGTTCTLGSSCSPAGGGSLAVSSTYTSSATLSVLNKMIVTQMTSLGQAITLPAATSLTTGSNLALLDNTHGNYAVGIRDNTGVLIAVVAPGGYASLSLETNSTAAGAWAISGTGLQAGLVTLTWSTTTLGNVMSKVSWIIDSNTSVQFVTFGGNGSSSNTVYAIIVDAAGKVVSTPLALPSTFVPSSLVSLSSSSALVLGIGNGAVQAVALTISGTSPSLSLSAGALATASGLSSSSVLPSAVTLSSSQALVTAWSSGGAAMVLTANISGTTVTWGTAVTLYSTPSSACSLYASGSAGALAVCKGTSSFYYLIGTSVSGTAVSVGSANSLGSYGPTYMLAVTSSKWINLWSDGSHEYADAVQLSGTTVTSGSTITLNTNTSNGSFNSCSTMSLGSPNYFFCATNSNASSMGEIAVFSESAGTMTLIADNQNVGFPTNTSGFTPYAFPSGPTDYLVAQDYYSASVGSSVPMERILQPYAVSSSGAVTVGAPLVAPAQVNSKMLQLGSQRYLTVTQFSAQLFTSNGLGVTAKGNIGGTFGAIAPVATWSSRAIFASANAPGSWTDSRNVATITNVEFIQ